MAGAPADATDARLRERYGSGRAPRSRHPRRTGVTTAVVSVMLAAAVALWAWWAGLLGGEAEIESRAVGYEVLDDGAVSVSWQLSAPPGTEVSCALQALNARYGVVGWKVVDVPASDRRTRTLTDQLRTVGRAETGLIYRCWLP